MPHKPYKPASPGDGRVKWTEEDKQLLRKLVAERVPRKEIASIMGRAVGTINERVKRMGLSNRRPRTGWAGCDEICEKCRYSDCIKPDHLM